MKGRNCKAHVKQNELKEIEMKMKEREKEKSKRKAAHLRCTPRRGK